MGFRKLPPQDELSKLVLYDNDTGLLYWRRRTPDMFAGRAADPDQQCKTWNSNFAGKPALHVKSKKGYRYGSIWGIPYRAHRIIWKLVTGAEPKQIDHIDGCPDNNRIENLRDVEHYENQQNMKRPRHNMSGVVGVCWSESIQRWRADIGHKGNYIHIGAYRLFSEAVIARQAAEKVLGYHPNHGR